MEKENFNIITQRQQIPKKWDKETHYIMDEIARIFGGIDE